MPTPLIQEQIEKFKEQFCVDALPEWIGNNIPTVVMTTHLLTALEAVEAEATKVERERVIKIINEYESSHCCEDCPCSYYAEEIIKQF